jgi:hypothetical protein
LVLFRTEEQAVLTLPQELLGEQELELVQELQLLELELVQGRLQGLEQEQELMQQLQLKVLNHREACNA